MPLNNQWTRVIVLTPPPPDGCGLSELLRHRFAAMDWFAIEQHDPILAMAELCLREKAQTARAAWGLQRLERIALVIAQSAYWLRQGISLRELTSAVSRYLPTATIWEIVDDEVVRIDEPMEQVGGSDARPKSASTPMPQASKVAEARTQPASAHIAPPLEPLRLVGDADPNDSKSAPPATPSMNVSAKLVEPEDDVADKARITRQEIEMLLGDNPVSAGSEAAS